MQLTQAEQGALWGISAHFSAITAGDTSQAADVASRAAPGLAGAKGKMDVWT